MSFREFVAGELIDIIEWIDESGDTMVSRFSRPKNEIKNGAQLIVRQGQVAMLVDQGRVADVFAPGRHTLATSNLPVLSTLRGWAHGFASPFKADVIFVNTKQFTGQKWGTGNPVMVRDPELGPVRLRAYGTYAIRVGDAPKFVREIVGTNSLFLVDGITEQLRNFVVARVSEGLADGNVPVFDLSREYPELGDRVRERVQPQFQQYGLELTQLVVENVSLPAEVEAALDQRSKMNVVGDLDRYAKLQQADALRDAARNPGGGAAAGVGIGMGAAMAQSAFRAPRNPTHDGPPPLPQQDEWFYGVEGQQQGPTNVAGLRAQVAAGRITGDTLVWKRGMGEWAVAASVPEVAALLKQQ
jgi:membrane protease subunit (stomatin/prohibitin family)